jgi:hypothetical protein
MGQSHGCEEVVAVEEVEEAGTGPADSGQMGFAWAFGEGWEGWDKLLLDRGGASAHGNSDPAAAI